METKTSKAISLYKEGKFRESLSIFKTFKIGVSKDEQRTIQIAYECEAGACGFYQQIGTDTKKVLSEVHKIIKKIWL